MKEGIKIEDLTQKQKDRLAEIANYFLPGSFEGIEYKDMTEDKWKRVDELKNRNQKEVDEEYDRIIRKFEVARIENEKSD